MGYDSSRRHRVGQVILKSPRWFLETTNLKTDHKVRDSIQKMTNSEILSKKASAIRGVSSSTTGVVFNTVLGIPCPVFFVGTTVNAWQLNVSAINLHRIRQEIQRRVEKDPGFAAQHQYHRKRRILRNVLIGVTIKACICTLVVGIVGFDNVADNFAELGHHVVSVIASQNIGDVFSNTTVHHHLDSLSGSKSAIAFYHPHDRAATLAVNHAHVAAVDKGIHKLFAGVGDAIANKVGGTWMHITGQTSWYDLRASGHTGAAEAAAIGVVGLLQELTQFAAQAIESGCDKYQERRDRVRRYLAN